MDDIVGLNQQTANTNYFKHYGANVKTVKMPWEHGGWAQ
jgi:hypothetical protein